MLTVLIVIFGSHMRVQELCRDLNDDSSWLEVETNSFLLEHLSPNYSKVLLKSQIQTHVCRYYVLFTRNKIVHKPSMPEIDKGVNALNLVLQTLPMFSKSTQPHLLKQPQSKYLLQNSSSLATLLTIFQVIFITWYFKKGINRCVDRFF